MIRHSFPRTELCVNQSGVQTSIFGTQGERFSVDHLAAHETTSTSHKDTVGDINNIDNNRVHLEPTQNITTRYASSISSWRLQI